MALPVPSYALQSLGSKHSLSCTLRTRATHPPPHRHATFTRDVRIYAQQKTRVVRGPCYVTRDVSVAIFHDSNSVMHKSDFCHDSKRCACLAEHRYRSNHPRGVFDASTVQGES